MAQTVRVIPMCMPKGLYEYHLRMQDQRRENASRRAAGGRVRSEGSELSIAKRANTAAVGWKRKVDAQRALHAASKPIPRPLGRQMGQERRVDYEA